MSAAGLLVLTLTTSVFSSSVCSSPSGPSPSPTGSSLVSSADGRRPQGRRTATPASHPSHRALPEKLDQRAPPYPLSPQGLLPLSRRQRVHGRSPNSIREAQSAQETTPDGD